MSTAAEEASTDGQERSVILKEGQRRVLDAPRPVVQQATPAPPPRGKPAEPTPARRAAD